MNIRQAKSLTHGTVLHYTGKLQCGVGKKAVTRVRVSGKPKTWKRDPYRVQVPVKYGLYENSYITEDNLKDFHLEEDCPLLKKLEKDWRADEFPEVDQEPEANPEDEPKVLKLSGRMVEIPTTEQEFRQTIKRILG